MWKGYHITDREETQTAISLLGFLGLKWQLFKLRVTYKEALFQFSSLFLILFITTTSHLYIIIKAAYN